MRRLGRSREVIERYFRMGSLKCPAWIGVSEGEFLTQATAVFNAVADGSSFDDLLKERRFNGHIIHAVAEWLTPYRGSAAHRVFN